MCWLALCFFSFKQGLSVYSLYKNQFCTLNLKTLVLRSANFLTIWGFVSCILPSLKEKWKPGEWNIFRWKDVSQSEFIIRIFIFFVDWLCAEIDEYLEKIVITISLDEFFVQEWLIIVFNDSFYQYYDQLKKDLPQLFGKVEEFASEEVCIYLNSLCWVCCSVLKGKDNCY